MAPFARVRSLSSQTDGAAGSNSVAPHMDRQPNNPLHGLTLESILTQLVEHYGWEKLGERIRILCFTSSPSIKSSLTFLRRTPWARKKVEELFLEHQRRARGLHKKKPRRRLHRVQPRSNLPARLRRLRYNPKLRSAKR